MPETIVELTGITKAFGENNVLRGIDMVLRAGEVTALMGANGAGKSTLVKILSGVHPANGGRIVLQGQPFNPARPSDAIAAGVVTVHQSINDGVIPDLDVASNLMLDQFTKPGSGFFLNKRQMRAAARELAATMALDVDVRQMVSELGLADRQLVAIARAMAHHPKLLILDEPTSSLSAAEAARLFDLLDRLRASGVAILYISHRSSDIRRIADRIITMRDGRISGIFEEKPLDYEAAVQAMLGQKISEMNIAIPPKGAPVLRLEDVILRHGARPFSVDIHANEVVAVTGLVGSGKTALASALFGLQPLVSGRMLLNAKPYAPHQQREAIANGVFLCPKDRATNAVVQDFNISANITVPFLARHSKNGFLSRRSERNTARRIISDLGIVCQHETDTIMSLSGGNQQKTMVGRWLAEASSLLVLDEPFQGVDIKARRDIGQKIRETAHDRATLVMVAEMDEAIEIADRILVMNDHSIVGDHRNEKLNMNSVLAQVAGKENAGTGDIHAR